MNADSRETQVQGIPCGFKGGCDNVGSETLASITYLCCWHKWQAERDFQGDGNEGVSSQVLLKPFVTSERTRRVGYVNCRENIMPSAEVITSGSRYRKAGCIYKVGSGPQ